MLFDGLLGAVRLARIVRPLRRLRRLRRLTQGGDNGELVTETAETGDTTVRDRRYHRAVSPGLASVWIGDVELYDDALERRTVLPYLPGAGLKSEFGTS